MPQTTDQCVKCGGVMRIGFVSDKADYNMPTYLIWGDGEPKESIWTGVKPSGQERKTVDKVMRCTDCGYLEFYATLDYD
jgi:hypothetical protein